MKQFIIIILMLLSGSPWLYAQNAKTYVHKGNKLYEEKKYDEAAKQYAKSLDDKGLATQGNFNLGDALFKQKKFDDAAQKFTDIGSSANSNPMVKAGAYHNLGNTLLEGKKYQESIDAYQKALLNNPKDDQTRYNLAYAQEKLKQQQQQQKKQNKNDKNNQNNKNNQNKQNQDKKDQDKKNQDQKNQDKKDQDKKDQQKQQQNQPDKVSKDDAQRMLDALNNNEKNTQDKLKNKKVKAGKAHIDKDW